MSGNLSGLAILLGAGVAWWLISWGNVLVVRGVLKAAAFPVRVVMGRRYRQ